MPRLLHARAPQDAAEELKVRKLANSRQAPGDWIMRARMIVCSWDGLRTKAIAEELSCHPQTVRERFHRFNAQGIDGLGDSPRRGAQAAPLAPETRCVAGRCRYPRPRRLC